LKVSLLFYSNDANVYGLANTAGNSNILQTDHFKTTVFSKKPNKTANYRSKIDSFFENVKYQW